MGSYNSSLGSLSHHLYPPLDLYWGRLKFYKVHNLKPAKMQHLRAMFIWGRMQLPHQTARRAGGVLSHSWWTVWILVLAPPCDFHSPGECPNFIQRAIFHNTSIKLKIQVLFQHKGKKKWILKGFFMYNFILNSYGFSLTLKAHWLDMVPSEWENKNGEKPFMFILHRALRRIHGIFFQFSITDFCAFSRIWQSCC